MMGQRSPGAPGEPKDCGTPGAASTGDNDDPASAMPSSPPSTPIVAKSAGHSKRVIPDTPGSPPVQVLASSPANTTAPSVPTSVNTKTMEASGPVGVGNATAAAVAEAMKLAYPQFPQTPQAGVNLRRPGFPSQAVRAGPSPAVESTVIPQSPPNSQQPARFGNYIQQFTYTPAARVVGGGHPAMPMMTPQQQQQYAAHQAYVAHQQLAHQQQQQQRGFAPMSMASAYGMVNRPRLIQSRPPAVPGQQSQVVQNIVAGPSILPKGGTPLRKFMDMFPHMNQIQAINAINLCRGNYEDAAARLSENPNFGAEVYPPHLGGPPAAMIPQYNPQQMHFPPLTYGTQPARTNMMPTQQLSAKRTLKTPHQTIQQKYTHLNQAYVPNTFPYNLASGPGATVASITPFPGPPPSLTQFSKSPPRPTAAQAKKRKLVRGTSKRLDSDGDSLSEEPSSEEEIEYRDDVFDEKVLDVLNSASAEEIADITFTPVENVKVFVGKRPFGSLDVARMCELPPNTEEDSMSTDGGAEGEGVKRGRARRSAKRGRNIGNRIVDGAEEVLKGYNGVDDLISECEAIGKRVREKLAKWTALPSSNALTPTTEEGALTLTNIPTGSSTSSDTPSTATTDPSPAPSDTAPPEIVGQPNVLADDVSLKDYQLVGVNWLNLLYKEGLSCILADEMGLGKTCQVIAFLGGLLKQTDGQRGKHLVVVPSSTIGIKRPWFVLFVFIDVSGENWLREFKRFCPSLIVEPYYGDQKTRAELRYELESKMNSFHVIVTTYSSPTRPPNFRAKGRYKLATGAKEDRGWLKKFNFDVCIFDEGHMLKNSMSKQYIELMKLTANFRVLLTGTVTPLSKHLRFSLV